MLHFSFKASTHICSIKFTQYWLNGRASIYPFMDFRCSHEACSVLVSCKAKMNKDSALRRLMAQSPWAWNGWIVRPGMWPTTGAIESRVWDWRRRYVGQEKTLVPTTCPCGQGTSRPVGEAHTKPFGLQLYRLALRKVCDAIGTLNTETHAILSFRRLP